MDSQQLTKVMELDRLGILYFKGVFPADKLLKQTVKQFPCGYIANTDPSHKPGVHWVAFYFDERGKGEFFCSYGEPPGTYNFEPWLERNATYWTYQKKRLQGDLSSVCGQYCLFFLLHRFRDISIDSFFTSDKDVNDSWVNEFISKRFNLDIEVMDRNFLLNQIARSFNGRTDTLHALNIVE